MDFVPEDKFDLVTDVVMKMSTTVEEENSKHRRRDEDINENLLEKGLDQAHRHEEKLLEWLHEAEKQEALYVDLVSDED